MNNLLANRTCFLCHLCNAIALWIYVIINTNSHEFACVDHVDLSIVS